MNCYVWSSRSLQYRRSRAGKEGRLLSDWLSGLQKTSDTKFADYKPHVAFFFPGQGAQAVGMAKVSSPFITYRTTVCHCAAASVGKRHNQVCPLQDVVNEVTAAKQLFQQASDILSYDLLKACLEGKHSPKQLQHCIICACIICLSMPPTANPQ